MVTTSRRLCLAPLGFLNLAPPDLIRLAAASGFNAVALRTGAALPGGLEYPLLPGGELLRETRRAIDDTGVAVDSVEVAVLRSGLDLRAVDALLEGGAAVGATRLLCNSDDDDLDLVTDLFARVCDLAARRDMAVDLEFMRFRRGVRTLEDAMQVVRGANRLNGYIVLDTLHLCRAGGSAESVRQVPAHRIATVQLCDGPLMGPPDDLLADEARNGRLPLGEGALPIREILAALAPDVALAVEVPLGPPRDGWTDARRAALLAETTRAYLG